MGMHLLRERCETSGMRDSWWAGGKLVVELELELFELLPCLADMPGTRDRSHTASRSLPPGWCACHMALTHA